MKWLAVTYFKMPTLMYIYVCYLKMKKTNLKHAEKREFDCRTSWMFLITRPVGAHTRYTIRKSLQLAAHKTIVCDNLSNIFKRNNKLFS